MPGRGHFTLRGSGIKRSPAAGPQIRRRCHGPVPVPSAFESWMLAAGWGPAQPPPAADADCGCSPLRPRLLGQRPTRSSRAEPQELGHPRRPPRPGSGRRRRARGGRLGAGQRQSASEREKLRMRTLARASTSCAASASVRAAPAGPEPDQDRDAAPGHPLHRTPVGRAGPQRGQPAAPAPATRRRGAPSQAAPTAVRRRRRREAAARPAAGAAVSWGSPPARPGALAAPELRDPPVLYDRRAAGLEGPAMEPSPHPRLVSPPSRGTPPWLSAVVGWHYLPSHVPTSHSGTSPGGAPPPAARLACSSGAHVGVVRRGA